MTAPGPTPIEPDATRPVGPAGFSDRKAALYILVATVIGGGSAYVLSIIAGLRLGAHGYAPVGVFLSALYLVITALAGVQQEVTRAAHPRGAGSASAGRPVLRNFIVTASAIVVLALTLTAPLWAVRAFPGHGYSLVAPLIVGAAAYLLVAALSGVLYGLAQWRAVSALIAGDGVIRLGVAGVTMFFTRDPRIIAWMLVVPFVAITALAWPWARRNLTGRFALDVGYRQLSWNVARTMAAAAATGVLVSGFPLLVAATSPGVETALLSSTMLAINLARAPLIVLAISFQGLLMTTFRRATDLDRSVARLLAAVGGVSLALGILGWTLGPRVFEGIFGADFHLRPALLTAIIASGGTVAALCVTGSATLSRGLHGWYAGGWIASAASAVGILLVPMEYESRVALALIVGPIAGLAIHVAALRRAARRPSGPRARQSTPAFPQ